MNIFIKRNAGVNMPVLILLAVSIFTTLAVSHGDTTLVSGFMKEKLIPLFRDFLMMLVLVFTTWKQPSKHIVAKVFWILLWIFYMYFYSALGVGYGLDFSAFCNITFIFSIFFFTNDNLVKIVSLFRVFIVIMSALGIIAYANFVYGGFLPYYLTDYYSDLSNALYVNCHYSYLLLKDDGIRLCGLFNEPGYFGTFVALFLILDEIRLKRISNIILLIAGILSFSMAFFVLLAIGSIYFILKRKKYTIVVFIGAILLGAPILRNIHFENESVNLFFERIDFITSGDQNISELRKDDNFQKVEREFDDGVISGKIFGYGTGFCKKKGTYDTSSYKKLVIEWGYLGFGLIFIILLWLIFTESKINKDVLFYILCFFISVIQRPNIFAPAYILLLFGGVHYILSLQNERTVGLFK